MFYLIGVQYIYQVNYDVMETCFIYKNNETGLCSIDYLLSKKNKINDFTVDILLSRGKKRRKCHKDKVDKLIKKHDLEATDLIEALIS